MATPPIWKNEEEKEAWMRDVDAWLSSKFGVGVLYLNELVARPFLWGDFTFAHEDQAYNASKKPKTEPTDLLTFEPVGETHAPGLNCYCVFVGSREHEIDKPVPASSGPWPNSWTRLKACTKKEWSGLIRFAPFVDDAIDHHKNHAYVSLSAFSEVCDEVRDIMRQVWSLAGPVDEGCNAATKAFAPKVRASADRYCDFAAKLPRLIQPDEELVVIGDLHGGLRDVWKIIEHITDDDMRLPPRIAAVVFLGDIVDRSYFSIETFCLVSAFFMRNQLRVFFVRGNHESPTTWIGHATASTHGHTVADITRNGPTLAEMRGHAAHDRRPMDIKRALESFDRFTQTCPVVLFARFANNKRVQLCHGAFPWHSSDPGRWGIGALQTIESMKLSRDVATLKDITKSLLSFIAEGGTDATGDESLERGKQILHSAGVIQEDGKKRRSLMDTNLISSVYSNYTRPGVSHRDAVEWCQRFNLHGIYSGHQDFIDVGIHLPVRGTMGAKLNVSYSHLHTGMHSNARDTGGAFRLRTPEEYASPQIVVTSTAVDARDAERKRMRVTYLKLVLR